MDYEIDFRPVGDASKAGDAIIVRYLTEGEYKLIVVDGGTDESGKALVTHIKNQFGSNAVIQHIISTHPDTDHACGLRAVMESFRVENLWLHGVWHHTSEMLHLFQDKRWTEHGLADYIREKYSVIDELIDLAAARGIPVYEPFQGQKIGPFTVLSPARRTYIHLVPQFRKTPACDNDALNTASLNLGSKNLTATRNVFSTIIEAVRNVAEAWNIETLKENPKTAAENESSTVLFGQFGDRAILLTADAGVNALTWACNYADSQGFRIADVNMLQVPHHGSRSNVSPTLLNRLIGPIMPYGSAARRIAVVSAPKDDSSHPRKIVLNAFKRRGVDVYGTQGSNCRHWHGNFPARLGETNLAPFELFSEVEAYD